MGSSMGRPMERPMGRPMERPMGRPMGAPWDVPKPYKRRTSGRTKRLQWERQHGVTTAWLASARRRPVVLAL